MTQEGSQVKAPDLSPSSIPSTILTSGPVRGENGYKNSPLMERVRGNMGHVGIP